MSGTQPAPISIAPPCEVRMPLEHAVEHEHRKEPGRGVVHDHEVLRTDDLGAAELLGDRTPVVHPVAADGQAPAADMQHEGDTPLGQPRPEPIVVGMTRRSASRRSSGEPDDAESVVQRGVELGDRTIGLVEVADGDTVQAASPSQNSAMARLCAR